VSPRAGRRRVRFASIDRDAECGEHDTIFQGARRAGVRIVGACGGRGVCGTCAVRVAEGEVELLHPTAPHADAQLANGWLRTLTDSHAASMIMFASLGGGVGLISGVGVPNFRVVTGASWAARGAICRTKSRKVNTIAGSELPADFCLMDINSFIAVLLNLNYSVPFNYPPLPWRSTGG